MQILARVSNSSLSVLSRHGATGDNLRRESAARGVAGERIQMAPVLGKRQHVQRMREASLFLDTFPYGAHTTCSEAMYAGLPVLTRPGKSFASRVAASLLYALHAGAAGRTDRGGGAGQPEDVLSPCYSHSQRLGGLEDVAIRMAREILQSCPQAG